MWMQNVAFSSKISYQNILKFEVAYFISGTLFNSSWGLLREALKLRQTSGIRWTMISFLHHLDIRTTSAFSHIKSLNSPSWLSLLRVWRLLLALQLTDVKQKR